LAAGQVTRGGCARSWPRGARGPGGGPPGRANPRREAGAAPELHSGAAWACWGLIEGLTRAAQAPIGIWIADSHSARPEPAAPAAKTGPAHTGGSGHLRTSAIARTNGIVSPAVYILWLQLPSLTLTSMSRRSVPAKRRPERALPGLGGSTMSAPARQSRPGPSHQRRAACDGQNEQVSSKLLICVIMGAYGMS
jgi:hypothetical protein